MVTRLLLALLLCLSAAGIQAASIRLQLDHASIALGEPLQLSLSQAAATSGLDSLDTTPLSTDFEILARTLNRSDDGETLTLTLYPLRSGRLEIPSLRTATAHTPQTRVTVTPASADTLPVRFSLATDPTQLIQRQPARLTLEIDDDGGLNWQRPELPSRTGLQLRALGKEQLSLERDGVRVTAHRFHWALIPTAAGELDLELPMLEADKFGQRLRFPPPTTNLTAQATPAWLPQEAAVGRPEVALTPLPANWAMQRPLAWRFEVIGGYSERALKTLLQLQLAPYAEFNAYPPSVELLPNEDVNSPLTRLAATLILQPRASGKFQLPDIALPYFDPASQTLQSLQLTPGKVMIYNPLLERLRDFGLLLLGAMLLPWAGWRLQRRLARHRARRHALARIEQADDLPALIAAIKAYSPQPGTRPAATLGIWRSRVSTQGDGQPLARLVIALEDAHYGRAASELDTLKQLAITTLKQRRL